MSSTIRRDSPEVASLREKIVLLREEGFSYGAIAKKYRISKPYAIKPVHEYHAEIRRRGTGYVGLKARQRRFARALIDNKSPQEAANYAAQARTLPQSEAQEWAEATLADQTFRRTIRQIFELEEPDRDRTGNRNVPMPLAR